MSELAYLFGELADEAKVYEVTEAALRGARRRRRARLLAPPAVATAMVVAVVVAWAARPVAQGPPHEPAVSAGPAGQGFPQSCVVQVLPVPPGLGGVLVSAMDPSGRVVMGWPDPSGDAGPALIWVDGVPRVVTPPGRQAAFADMNSSGVGVGSSLIGEGDGSRQAAWVYRDGQFTLLRGEDSSANAVNDRGEIVGEVGGLPVVWRGFDAEPQLLAMPGQGRGNALDIDADGTVIGETFATRPRHAYVWPPGGSARTGADGDFYFTVRDGWVAGATGTEVPFGGRAARWNLRTGQRETLAGELSGMSARVSAQGWVAGVTGVPEGKRAQLVSVDRVVALPPPAQAPQGELAIRAISADGHTVAGSVIGSASGEAMPLVWRCR